MGYTISPLGFGSSSGGATRYVPPAFRNTGGGSGDKDEDGGHADCHTSVRSLGEVTAAGDGTRGSGRFLRAALFLLTATTAAPTATRTEEAGPRKIRATKKEIIGNGSASTSVSTSTGRPTSALRAAARAAKDKLGCKDCLHLSAETGCDAIDSRKESAGDSKKIRDKQSTTNAGVSNVNNSSSNSSNSSSSSNEWWSRLRQAERGWIANETGRQEGSTAITAAGAAWGGGSWAGLELKLRRSDMWSPDGRTAIVDFLKGRVGVGHLVSRKEEERQDEKAGAGSEGIRSPEEIQPPESAEPIELTAAPAIAKSPAAARGGERGGVSGGRRDLSITTSSSAGHNNVGGAVEAPTDGAGAVQEWGRSSNPDQAQEREVAVLLAVLVFGSELSKRDRAELHGQAENTEEVASSSHGVGDGRFLSLTCGLGSRAAAVELDLSPEKVFLVQQY